jgi:hypothetical protein
VLMTFGDAHEVLPRSYCYFNFIAIETLGNGELVCIPFRREYAGCDGETASDIYKKTQ